MEITNYKSFNEKVKIKRKELEFEKQEFEKINKLIHDDQKLHEKEETLIQEANVQMQADRQLIEAANVTMQADRQLIEEANARLNAKRQLIEEANARLNTKRQLVEEANLRKKPIEERIKINEKKANKSLEKQLQKYKDIDDLHMTYFEPTDANYPAHN
jgi:hypothetical protein